MNSTLFISLFLYEKKKTNIDHQKREEEIYIKIYTDSSKKKRRKKEKCVYLAVVCLCVRVWDVLHCCAKLSSRYARGVFSRSE